MNSDKPSAEQFIFKPIGYLNSCFPDKFGVPRQSGLVDETYSELKILPEFQPEISLSGLTGFSHVWLQFVFHLNSSVRFHAKIHPPRLNGESMGLFATRSPHRPNPIGLSLVRLVEVKNTTLRFAGADLVEGTPILDIKPYLPHIESVPNAKGGWALNLEEPAIKVNFSAEALEKLQLWIAKTGRNELREVIIQILKQDPRPKVYKGFESGDSPYRNKHAFRLYEGDIHFQFEDPFSVIVFDILL